MKTLLCINRIFVNEEEVLDDENMPFRDALQPESGLALADRRRVKVFLDEAEAELLKVALLLGLS